MDVPDWMHGTEKVAVGGLESVSKFERVLCAAFGLELYSGNYNDCKKLTGSAGKDFISDMKIYEQAFRAIKESGMKIMLDDFGADYASIGLLKNDLVDIVKVDRTIVRRVVKSSFDLDFIRFIVKICHDMEIEVCLEGVAEMEELKLVEDMIFDYMQGDLFGKATDARLTFK